MKKMLAILLAMAMTLCAAGAMADAVSNVPYIRRGWDSQKKTVTQTEATAASCTVVEAAGSDTDVTWNGGWYVVDRNVTIASRITVTGDVHLILMDGKTLTASKGIEVSGANSLTIYGQSADSGTLLANGNSTDAGIGGSMDKAGGTITIHGGTVNASSGSIGSGAGIGGGREGDGGTITIYGGTVTASGGSNDAGAGIGGGNSGAGGTITIHGGTVTATGNSGGGAGIGGGYDGGAGGTITIHGGTVNASSGSVGGGAGIGGGDGGSGIGGAGGTIRIAGGTVNASSSIGAGIGGGGGYYGGAGGEVTITGGTVTAQGKWGMAPQSRACAIGGGSEDASQGSLTVSGDQVVMTAGNWKDYKELETFQIFDAGKYLTEKYAYAHIEVTNEPADGGAPGAVGDLPQTDDLPQTGSLPQTGDPSMLGAWALLLGASAAGLRLRRKK